MSHLLAMIAFVIFDIIFSALTPYVSCLVAGVIAKAGEVEKTTEVFYMVAMIVFVSANLLEVLDIMFEKFTSPGSKPSTLYPWVLRVLSLLNLIWLVLSIRALVRSLEFGPGATLGSTPFGFFLASLLFTCCKFMIYFVIYTVNVALRRSAEAGEEMAELAEAAMIASSSVSNAKLEDKVKSVQSLTPMARTPTHTTAIANFN